MFSIYYIIVLYHIFGSGSGRQFDGKNMGGLLTNYHIKVRTLTHQIC